MVVGGRALRITAESRDGTCYFAIVAIDPATGQEVWRNDRRQPAHAERERVRPARRPGRWAQRGGRRRAGRQRAGPRRVRRKRAVAGRAGRAARLGRRPVTALVKSADSSTLYAAELRDGVQWDRGVNEGVQAALARYAAIVLDERPDRLIVVNQFSGAVLRDVRSSAEVLAVGPRRRGHRGRARHRVRPVRRHDRRSTRSFRPIRAPRPTRTPARCAAAPNRSPAPSADPIDG